MHKTKVIQNTYPQFTSEFEQIKIQISNVNMIETTLRNFPRYRIGQIVQTRQVKVWYHPDVLFRLTDLYKEHQECIKVLHGFSNRVIRERKAEIAEQNNNNNNSGSVKNLNISDDSDESKYELVDFPRKKRLAFLDLLIEASQGGTELSDEDIREEGFFPIFLVAFRF